ncbi:MAG TPA: nuclear transport factor 2 family protein [Holophagaceae bacterium]|nr:nuclear transport factor 2 family protein [Holophagaceae bacterium]
MLDPALRATFEACLDAARRGDAPALAACFQEDAEGLESLSGEARGAQALAEAVAALKARIPDLELTPLRTYGEGPELAVRLRLSGRGREAEGVWAFRFDGEGRITRLVALFEPARLLSVSASSLSKRQEERIIDYFRTYNSDEEDAHMSLASPKLVYFGAVSRMTAEGIETARGVFRSARTRMGLKRFDPMKVFGSGPYAAVLVRIYGSQAGGPTEEGIWVLRFDAEDRFDRVSILWNPGSFLSWPMKPGA